jgi:formate dehydrogenase subunit gamma
MMDSYEPWNMDRAASIIVTHGTRSDTPAQSGAMPIMHALQAAFGFIHAEAIPMVAAALNISRADVHGFVTFYHDFRRTPPGRHVLRLCRAEACQAVGGEAVADRLKTVLGMGWHDTTADGRVTLEPVFCLGLCASGPAALVDGQPVGRLTPQAVPALVRGLA